jgi:4-hydroxy-3-polyprenylbenzoate decarboxylase
MAATPKRIIVGISGASGIVYGIRLLEILRATGVETHVVMTNAAKVTLSLETDLKLPQMQTMADHFYQTHDIAAAISSGSFKTYGMIVCPCSMRTLAEIANGITASLLPRAADVILKERRRLVLVVRETPLHLGHLRNMTAVTEMGAIVYPPVPAMYAKPTSLEEMIDHTVGRVLDLFDIDAGTVRRWREGESAAPARESAAPAVQSIDEARRSG